jgi:hypothetical protein
MIFMKLHPLNNEFIRKILKVGVVLEPVGGD